MPDGDVSRLAVFACYDRQGIIDDYIPYLLNDLKENLSRLVIVVNGELTGEGRQKLEALTPYITRRENSGFDAGAWKYALTDYLGWDEVAQYDELLLLNDTFFGPFYPFSRVFEKMAERNVDFWGLTRHGRRKDDPFHTNPYGYWPEHIQSYFTVIRRKMHASAAFKEYWERLPAFSTFREAVGMHETVFSRHFAGLGFTWDAFISNGDKDRETAYSPYGFNASEILEQGFPVIKRKEFSFPLCESLEYNDGGDYRRALEWVKANTCYDVRMIFQNVIRNYSIADIHDALHLDYVIGGRHPASGEKDFRDVAVVLYISNEGRANALLPYIRHIPGGAAVFVLSPSEKVRTMISSFTGEMDEIHLRFKAAADGKTVLDVLPVEIASILKDYRYICFCRDGDCPGAVYTMERSYGRHLMENALHSEAYIRNIISAFEADPCLGILSVPPAFDGYAAPSVRTRYWDGEREAVKGFLGKLGIAVPEGKNSPCLADGAAFWCRQDAVEPLLHYIIDSRDALGFGLYGAGVPGRSIAYIAQSQGYYTGLCMTEEYASLSCTAYRYALLNDWLGIHRNFDAAEAAASCGVLVSLKILWLAMNNFAVKAASRLSGPLYHPVLHWWRHRAERRELRPILRKSLAVMKKHRAELPRGGIAVAAEVRTAVQIHVFYTELLPDILARFRNVSAPYDLFVSTDTEEKKAEIEALLGREGIPAGQVAVQVFENRGRDVYPFLAQLRGVYMDYGYVAHFHTKKSPQNGKGGYWRESLLDALLGDGKRFERAVAYLESAPECGLLLPRVPRGLKWLYASVKRDRWNREAFRKSLSLLGVDAGNSCLEDCEFPLGTMFIARTAAVRQVFAHGFSAGDFPGEFGQTEHTLQHALELVWHPVCAATGFDFAVV